MRILALIVGMLLGASIVFGAGYAYHFWGIDGVPCFWIAGGGLATIGTAISKIDYPIANDEDEDEDEDEE